MAEITEEIKIAIQDGFSNALKLMNAELSKALSAVAEVDKKFGILNNDIQSVGNSLRGLTSGMNNVKNAVVSISNASGSFAADMTAGLDPKALNRQINANSRAQNVNSRLINEELKHFDEILADRIKKTSAYMESVNKQASKETKEAAMEAQRKQREANAEFKKAQTELLRNSGQRRFTAGFSGGAAYALSGVGQRVRGQGGVIGLLGHLGQRLGENNSSWFGKTFGRGGKINNAFGGVLAKGTVDGLGINAGALALGGFALAVGGAGVAIKKFRESTLEAYSSMQKMSTNLEVVYGSKTQSNQAFSQIQQYATKSPFGVSQTTEMAVLLKQSGVYASELQSTLEMIGDVSSGNEEKMKRIANNYAQIQAIGHASMLDMRQFAYAGLPIYEEVAKTMKTDQASLRSMISDGKVTAAVIEETFKRMTGEGGVFYKAVNKGSQTRAAREVNLADIKNIALSNIGDYFWNNNGTKESLAQSWLGFKEGFWNILGNIGRNLSVSQNEEAALINQAYLKTLKDAYKQALSENNQPMAKVLAEEIQHARSTGRDENSMIAAFAAAFEKDLDLNNTTIVSDVEYNTLQRRWLEAHEVAMEPIDPTDPMSGARSDAAWAEVDYLSKILNAIESQSDFERRVADKENSNKAYQAFAYYMVKNESWAKSIVDATNKLAGKADSLTSLTAKYNEEYKNSAEGQKERKEKEKIDYEDYAKRMKNVLKVFDTNSKRFKLTGDGVNRDNILTALRSGVFKGEEIKLNQGVLTDEEFKGEMKTLHENLTHLDRQFRANFRGEVPLEVSNTLHDIRYLASRLAENPTQTGQDKLAKVINEFRNRQLPNLSEDIQLLITNAFEKITDIPEIAKRGTDAGSGKDLALYIPLWKRIAASATGWDATHINKGDQFIKDYSNQASRNVVAGGVQRLVSAGVMSEDILTRMRYTDAENKQKVRQIDWQQTESDMIKDALSMRDGVKKSAASLKGLSNSLASQLSVYEKLTNDMAGVGEDWSTINTSLKEGFKNNPHLKAEDFLDNAFEAYGKKQGGYGLSYDNEMGLVIENAGLGFKESVETLKEQLKKDPNSLKGDLKAVVESLKIDTLPKALDLLRKSTMALNDTIGIANTLANQANTWREQAAKSRGEAFGNSIGAMGALRAATSSTYEDTSHYLKQPYLYVDKALAQSSGAITKSINEQLARMVFSDTQFADIKSRYGEAVAKSDLSEGDNIKELLTLGRDWIKDMSFDDFVDAMSKYGLTKEEALKLIEPVNATSSRLIDVIENSAFVDKNNVPIIRNSSPVDTLSPEVEAMLSSFMTEFMGKMATTDFTTLTDKQKEQIRKDYGAKGDIDTNKISEAANKFQNAGDNYHAQVEAMMDMFSAFGITMTELIDSAKDAVKATEDKRYSDAAASVLRSNFYNPLEYVKDDVFLQKGNTISQQWLMRSLGYEGMSFSSMSENMTKQALENYSKGGTTYSRLIDKYKSKVGDAKFNSLSDEYNSLSAENINLEDGDPKKISNLERMKEILHEIGDEANESSLAFADMTKSTVELGKNLNGALQSFAANAIGSTMSTWGKSLAEGADAGKAMKENFRELSSGLMSTMGEMMTQAGLAMIIGSLGKGPKFYAGLALIAAGAGASFLGGMLGADDDSDETDSEYDKLLRIKDDLADLLKQAREDAIYYENTLRHKNAISGNDALTTKKVNDAIITPSGNIISTHPDDYLIATKTPQTLVGGGAPTINFSVVDKSTGIKVTQQKSTYNESTNSIDFEAVIESKVQEIIATSKGDDAFNARNARLRGKMVIA